MKLDSLPTPTPASPLSLSYSGIIRDKMFALKNWVFLDGIWNFDKCKSLIRKKCWMLLKAILRKR